MPNSMIYKLTDDEISDINPFMDFQSEIGESMRDSTFEADYSVINSNLNEKHGHRKTPRRLVTAA